MPRYSWWKVTRRLLIANLSLILWKIKSRSTEMICSQKHNYLMAALGKDSHWSVQNPYHSVKNRKNVYITLIQIVVCLSFFSST